MDRSALSSYVRTLARGPGRSRNLTEEEAYEAMSLILKGDAPPEAIGALLMLMRFRGENADEMKGFIRATHAVLPAWMQAIEVDIDWPSYAAGRSRGVPYFLLSALLLAKNGIRVFMHGFNSHHMTRKSSTEAALEALEIAPATDQAEVEESLSRFNFAYMPLRDLCPAHFELINLRDVLGLRSPVNTLLRGLNPLHAKASLIGVFHPPYIPLQSQTALKLLNGNALIFKGGGGEAERTPLKPVKMTLTSAKGVSEFTAPALLDKACFDTKPEEPNPAALKALWQGEINDEKAEATIIGTAAAALYSLEITKTIADAEEKASHFWHVHKQGVNQQGTAA